MYANCNLKISVPHFPNSSVEEWENEHGQWARGDDSGEKAIQLLDGGRMIVYLEDRWESTPWNYQRYLNASCCFYDRGGRMLGWRLPSVTQTPSGYLLDFLGSTECRK